jgi:hypothetical protein
VLQRGTRLTPHALSLFYIIEVIYIDDNFGF